MKEDFSKYNGQGTELRKAQLRMLDILVEFDKICRKHNIPYWISGGTCLGAVRHGGFIPWDDDIDVDIMRDDFLSLRNILKKELPANLIFQDETTDKFYYLKFAKIRDKNSYFDDKEFSNKVKDHGLYIDIFPIEKVPSFKIKAFIDFFYGRAFRRLKHWTENKWEYIVAVMLWVPCLIMIACSRFLAKCLFSKKISHTYGTGMTPKFRLSDIHPVKPIFFEGKKFLGPAKLDLYLTKLYGDYMTIPSKENRIVHSSEIKLNEVK